MSEEKEEKKGRKRTRDVLVDEDIEFKGLLLSEAVQKGLSLAGFEKPSPIQLQAIPLGKFGVDLIAQAKSGTGKTLVFSIIALETINTSLTSPQALILAPTREIAVQIVEVIKKVGAYIEPPLLCESFIGGTPVSQDINNLKRGCQILVGTPGRVKDLIENSNLNTETLRILIFDEADKLLEESFLKQIDWIVKKLPQRKQILALSATYTPQMLDIMKSYMNQPQFILLSPDTPSLEGVKQYYLKVSSKNDNRQKGKSLNANWDSFEQKSKSLIELLSKLSFNQCLIFCNNRDKAQNICEALNNEGWPSRFISGDIDQSDRLEIMEALKNFEIRVLVSTDLIARGVDIEKVNLVLNIDVPRDAETYLHRVGRTGRYGTNGVAVTFVTESEYNFLASVQSTYQTRMEELPDEIPKEFYEYQLEGKEKEQLKELEQNPNKIQKIDKKLKKKKKKKKKFNE